MSLPSDAVTDDVEQLLLEEPAEDDVIITP